MSGEDFLNKLYRDLNLSEEVQHTAKGTRDKNESVKRYMDRLERVHSKASGSLIDLDKLKTLYHRKYCIRKEDLPDSSMEDKITKQEESLDRWIDYFVSDGARYPMWAKYWAFQGMLKIGSYDRDAGIFQKRSKKTLAPFIEVDPELIDKCMEEVILYVGTKKVNDEELEKLVSSGNFSKLYVSLLAKKQENALSAGNMEDGKWIKFSGESHEEAERKLRAGIEPEYLRLFKSLQGYNTRWCTAGSELTAREQICGGNEYAGGDFYLYCTKDENNEYKVPRIAIRMDGEFIGEIRGIGDGQNIEDGLENIVEKKLIDFSYLEEEDLKRYLDIISNMKKLTAINKKYKQRAKLTDEEIRFIYEVDGEIEGFGWTKDVRIREILESRNMEEDFLSLSKLEDKIKFATIHPNIIREIDKNVEGYEDIALMAVKHDGYLLPCVDSTVPRYTKIAIAAVLKNLNAIYSVDKNSECYRDVIMGVAKVNGNILMFVKPEIEGYTEIAIECVSQNGNLINNVDSEFEDYKKIAIAAVRNKGEAIRNVDPNAKSFKSPDDFKEIAIEAVKKDGMAIIHIPENTPGFKEIAFAAVRQDGYAIGCINWHRVDYYKELVVEAAKSDPHVVLYLDPDVPGFKEAALIAVRAMPWKIRHIKRTADFKEIAIAAVEVDGLELESIPPNTEGYYDIAMAAVKQNWFAIQYVPSSIPGYYNLALAAVNNNFAAILYIDKNIKGYNKLMLISYKNNFKNLLKPRKKEPEMKEGFRAQQMKDICRDAAARVESKLAEEGRRRNNN